MIKRQIRLILLFSTFAGLISCNRGPMKDVNLDSGDYKMYFIDISQHHSENRSCEFIERYKNFYIDDNYVLNVFKNELIEEKDHEFRLGKCFYVIQLFQNQEIKFGAFLSLENKKLKRTKVYNFNLEKFETFKKEFKKLEAFIINCYSIKNSKKLISDIEENGGYIHGISGFEN